MRSYATLPGALVVAALCLLMTADTIRAQDLHPSRRPSPIGIATAFVGDAYVKVTYGRPYMRGRTIFGTNDDSNTFLVPFGQLWRTGANEATEITVTAPVLVNGERLEAGTYSIFTVPGPSEWTIHFSPHLGLDGPGRFDPVANSFEMVFDPADDVLTTTASSSSTSEPVDQFTISFEDAANGANMVLQWERTRVAILIAAAN